MVVVVSVNTLAGHKTVSGNEIQLLKETDFVERRGLQVVIDPGSLFNCNELTGDLVLLDEDGLRGKIEVLTTKHNYYQHGDTVWCSMFLPVYLANVSSEPITVKLATALASGALRAQIATQVMQD
jgi:hypothetical protein